MAVYVTGDTHGGIDMHKLSAKVLRRCGITLTAKDTLIILGDFGFPFTNKETNETKGEYTYWMKWLSEKPCTIAWVDGNHENFPFWDRQPISMWNGGRVQVHPKAKNVVHLLRGEVYSIEGEKYFAFGGAESHDKELRVPNVDWWADEQASPFEIANAERNLLKCGYEVDYILTHTPPEHVLQRLFAGTGNGKTEMFLTAVSDRTDYRGWFSGHLHRDAIIASERLAMLYNSVYSVHELVQRMDKALEEQAKEALKQAQKDDRIIC